MTNAELYNILIDNGWTIRKVIDDCAYKQLSDRQIQLIPCIKKLIDEYHIIMVPSVSTKEFSILDEFIHTGKKPRKIVHRHIINNKKQSISAKVPIRQIVEDYLQLAEYLENFKQGNRMGFVPYIKQDYIERALEEAKKHQ